MASIMVIYSFICCGVVFFFLVLYRRSLGYAKPDLCKLFHKTQNKTFKDVENFSLCAETQSSLVHE
jgi:hypothetical protein